MWEQALSLCLWGRYQGEPSPTISRSRSAFSRRTDDCPKLSIQPPETTVAARYNTKPLWTSIGMNFGGYAWSWKVRRAAEKNFRGWKQLRWVLENGTSCFFCYLSCWSRSCGFEACHAGEVA